MTTDIQNELRKARAWDKLGIIICSLAIAPIPSLGVQTIEDLMTRLYQNSTEAKNEKTTVTTLNPRHTD
jgi:hypothetical protein